MRKPPRPGSVGPARRRSPEDLTNHDDGFTLVELVIVLTVIPIVIAGISAAIITSFKDQAGIYNRLSDSHDAQMTSAYFVPDVESASSVSTSVAGVPCESIVAQDLLELTETVPGGQTEQIYYVDNTVNYHPDSQQNALLRIVCTGTNGTVPGGTTIVAHSVTSATATVACVTPAPVPPAPQVPWSPWIPCTTTGGSAPGVSSVSVAVSEVPTNSGNVPLDSFSYSLSATPRSWVPDTAFATGGAPVPGILLLGPNMKHGTNLLTFTGPATGQTLSTTASTQAGDIDVDSDSAGSVAMTGNDAINATGKFNIYHCAPSAGATCTNSAVSSTGLNNTTTPGPVSMAAAVQDPLGNLPTPGALSLSPPITPCTGQVGSTISISNQAITCMPGLYGSGLTISGAHDVITFLGGNGAGYQFGTPNCKQAQCALTGLTVTGASDTLNFQSATYVFEGSIADVNSCSSTGLSLLNKGGISISGGGDILQDGGAGVFLDIVGGPADFGCGVTTDNTVDLSPMTTGLYQGILLFDDRTPTAPQIVVLDGISTTGIIYAPDSFVDVWGNALNTTGSLVAQTLDLTGNLTIQ